MKRSLILIIPLILAAGCQKKNSFTVEGTVSQPSGKTVFLNMVKVNTLVFIDSATINKNGKFTFKTRADEPEFYQLGYSNSDFITILAEPGEKIKLTFKGKDMVSDYSVTGSEGSEKVRMLDVRLNRTKRSLDSLRTVYTQASKEPGFDQKGAALEALFNSKLKELRKKNIEFIITNLKSMASIKALYQRIDENTYVLYDPRDLQYLKIVSDTLGRYYPNSGNVQALAADVKNELNQMYSKSIQDLAKTSPVITLNPNLKDNKGNRISLSSLRGKTVLVAFWSVNSQDCVTENLQLKNLYKTYNKRGFEIYQINIDADEAKWKEAIRYDELPWINTREDDPSDPKNLILFNVQSLPANFLFDKDGQIIGTNLHGRSLQIKLNQLFNE